MTIQQRLREAYCCSPECDYDLDLWDLAADRIDTLEAALRNIDQAATVHTAKKIARAALEARRDG